MKVTISFVVPIYKVPQELFQRCVDSLVNQTEDDHEILLVDDGSEDVCSEMCDEYAARYYNVRCVHQNNQGVSGARNTGIANANGEWISFVDADDYITNDTVKILKRCLLNSDISLDILFFDGYAINNAGKKELNFFDNMERSIIGDKKDLIFDHMLPSHLGRKEIEKITCIGVPWAKVFRTSFLAKHKLKFPIDVKLGEDLIFVVNAVMAAQKYAYICEHLYYYVINNESLSRGYNSSAANAFITSYSHYNEIVQNCREITDISQRVNIYIVRLIILCFKICYLHPDNKKSSHALCIEIKHDMEETAFKTAIGEVHLFGNDIRLIIIITLLRLHCYALFPLARAVRKLGLIISTWTHAKNRCDGGLT